MIDLELTELQAELITSTAHAAAKEFPLTEGVAAALHGPAEFDTDRWRRVAALGWFGAGLAEKYGGVGLGVPAELLVVTELGRAAVRGPLVGTILAARLAADADAAQLAGELVDGTRTAGLIVGDRVVDAGSGGLALRFRSGRAELLELGEVRPLRAVDPLARVGSFEEAHVRHVTDDPALAVSRRLLLGGYLAGLAEAATDMAIGYAKIREQFGRPIGAFQATKHRCAEMLIRSYPVRTQLRAAAVLADSGQPGGGRFEAAAGHLLAIEAAGRNVEDNVQIHGGIGFTAEHPAGVLVKRALLYRKLGGSVAELTAEVLTTAPTALS